ncbi:hypothetical protein ACEQ8H_007236 [Pleosporales sp. CAS-2024a]
MPESTPEKSLQSLSELAAAVVDEYDTNHMRLKRRRARPVQHRDQKKEDSGAFAPDHVTNQHGLDFERGGTASQQRKNPQRLAREEARQRQKRDEEEKQAAEEAAWQRLNKAPTPNECFKVREKRNSHLYKLNTPAHVPCHYPPHGEFGNVVGYHGGNYLYHQNRRTYQARVEAAAQQHTQTADMDDDTDVDDTLPPEKKTTTSAMAGLQDSWEHTYAAFLDDSKS